MLNTNPHEIADTLQREMGRIDSAKYATKIAASAAEPLRTAYNDAATLLSYTPEQMRAHLANKDGAHHSGGILDCRSCSKG